MANPVNFLVKHKKAYLMIGGTFLPAMGAYMITRAMGLSQNVQNIAGVAGLIFGGIVTSKMLK
jgi:hypothetical protein